MYRHCEEKVIPKPFERKRGIPIEKLSSAREYENVFEKIIRNEIKCFNYTGENVVNDTGNW